MPNVLVFESDAAFAADLKTELTKRACTVTVVDDANVGLQTAASEKPDLILLAIELPRMNGFSVCNKLKRDPTLKEVPLIIMSSDSTEETFEQHRRLRTHAEDYVHKPLPFSDLLPRINALVPLADGVAAAGGEEDIVIDDDIAFEEEGRKSSAPASVAAEEVEEAPPPSHVDDEVDAFTESAFGAMIEEKEAKAAPEAPADLAPVSMEAVDLEAESIPPSTAATSAEVEEPKRVPASIPPRPRADSIDLATKEELAKSGERIRELEKELREARGKLGELEDEAKRGATKDAEVQRLQRELDDAKVKAATGAKGGGSAREVLDLREALNKKDKEILSNLKDQISHKEKGLLGLRDANLGAEREKADLDDRIVELEKQALELGRQLEGAKADKDQAAKRADDFKRKGEKAQGELDARTAEVADLKRKLEEESATRDAREASLRAEMQETIERGAESEKAAVAAAEERATSATREAAEQEKEAALAGARDTAKRERNQAITAREAELKKEQDSKLAALHRANEDAMNRLKADHAQATADAHKAHAAALEEQERKYAREHEAVVKEHESAYHATRLELTTAHDVTKADLVAARADLERLSSLKAESEASRDARIASLDGEFRSAKGELEASKSRLEEREASLAATEANLAATRQELREASDSLAIEQKKTEKARSKWGEDRAALDRAKDALASALAQIDEVEGRPLE